MTRSNRLRLRRFRNKRNTIIRGMIRQEIEIFCHRYRGTDHPLLISTFDDHRPHIKTDYKRVAKGIDQIAGSPSKAIYLWKNIHFDRNKNFEIFLFSNRISLVSKIIYIEIRGSRDRHGVVLLFWGFWILIQCYFAMKISIFRSVSSKLASIRDRNGIITLFGIILFPRLAS